MFDLPNEERSSFFEHKLLEPFKPMIKIMNMHVTPESKGCLPLIGHDAEAEEMQENIVLEIFLGDPVFVETIGGISGLDLTSSLIW